MPRPIISMVLCYAASSIFIMHFRRNSDLEYISIDAMGMALRELLDKYPLYGGSFHSVEMSPDELIGRLSSAAMKPVWTELILCSDPQQIIEKLVVCSGGDLTAYKYYKLNAILCGMDEPIIQVIAERELLPGLG